MKHGGALHRTAVVRAQDEWLAGSVLTQAGLTHQLAGVFGLFVRVHFRIEFAAHQTDLGTKST